MKKILIVILILSILFIPGCSYFELSTEDEILMGEQISLQVESYYDIYRDTETVARVQRIGQTMAKFSTRPYPYKFTVIDSDEVNAFALPGGHVYIYRGLLDMGLNDDQLAAVIGHELTHVEAQHFAQTYERMKKKELFYNIAILATGGAAYRPVQVLAYLDAYIFEPKYSRENETEADLSSVQMLTQAGKNPHEFSNLFKMWEKEKLGTTWMPGWMLDHPDFITRIRDIEEEISLQNGLLKHGNNDMKLLPTSLSERCNKNLKEEEKNLEDYLSFEKDNNILKVKWAGKANEISKIECYGLNHKQRIITDGRTGDEPFIVELKNGNSVKYIIVSVRYTNGDFLWDIVRI